MKILLVLPADEDWRIKEPHGKVPKRSALRFSVLGLSIVAALCDEGHEVRLIDENVEYLELDQKPDIVGISFMTGLAPRAYDLSKHFRSRGAVTVAGGFHPTLNAEEVSNHFDIVAVGQAEDTWPLILRDVESGIWKNIYRGDPDLDLAAVPFPRRDLLAARSENYITTSTIQTGRGCQHRCGFCSITSFFKHRHNSRPVEHVLEELRSAPKVLMFVDDNIIADVNYASDLFKKMESMGKRWVSQCSIEIADNHELLELAYKAGCRGLFIGIESVNKSNLDKMEKEFNHSRSITQRIKVILKMGIGVQAGMIVGMDGDSKHVFKQSLNFLQKNNIGALQLAILTPLPGTPLHTQFKKKNRILSYDWQKYDYRHCVIQPKQMSPEELQAGANWLYIQFYRLDRILIRAAKTAFISGLEPAWLCLRLGLTYRYSLKKEGRKGYNPAKYIENTLTMKEDTDLQEFPV